MQLHYPFGNHIGEQFCHLLAVAAVESDPETKDPVIYDCKCMKCGKEHVHVLDRDLLSFKTRNCGCSDRNDLTGMKIGRWTVLRRWPQNDKFNRVCWECKCECGETRVVTGNALTTGHSLSCGCLRIDRVNEAVFKDLTGQTFGRLTVIRRAPNGKPMPSCPSGIVMYECKCSCGKTCVVGASALKMGLTRSCGCLKLEGMSERFLKDLTGQTFGRLTVIKRAPNNGNSVQWECQCSCGNKYIANSQALLANHTRSCGCLHKDTMRKLLTKWTPDEKGIVRRYHGMLERCYNRNNDHYPNYGGRGICICDEWLNNPRAFVDWAKTHGFKPELSIDRIDVDGPYAPWNCRWADNKTQANNKQKSGLVKASVVKHLISKWAESTGTTYDFLFNELSKNHEFFTDHDIRAITK